MTDRQLQEAVLQELEWEPQVRAADIGVSAKDGVVAMSGFVDSYMEKIHAETAAKRVFGVRAIANDLEVKLPQSSHRPDPDIARSALNALDTQPGVPGKRIQVTVKDGHVTLEGELDWQFQRYNAEHAVDHLLGVKGVVNLTSVKPAPGLAVTDVRKQITAALHRAADLDARSIDVEISDSRVILRGHVRTWMERTEAEHAAWRAPGVRRVENHIAISP